jgi:protein-disulfide isomerase
MIPLVRWSWIPICVVALAPGAGCDGRSDDELRATIGDVVQQHLEAQAAKAETPKASDETEAELATLTARIEELEARLAVLETRPPVPMPIEVAAVAPLGTPERSAKSEGSGASTTYKIPIGESHTKGFDDALVTIVVWSDFECPHCARVEPIRQRIAKEFGADVRFAFKHCPLSGHPRAKPAAIAAEAAAEQGKFWDMHDKLFDNHTDLTDANFLVWAGEIGLDVKRFERDLGDAKLERRVQDQRDACTTFGVVGVPSFHVNGRYVEDGSFEGLQPVIEAEKRKAEALVTKGVAREGVYEATIADGKSGA